MKRLSVDKYNSLFYKLDILNKTCYKIRHDFNKKNQGGG